MTRAAGEGKSRMKSNVRFIPDGEWNRGGIGAVGRATLRAWGKARRGKLALPLGWVGYIGGDYDSGFQRMPFGPPWQWGRMGRRAIRGGQRERGRGRTRGEQSKGHHGAYKRRISYQVRAWERGGQGGGQHESQLSAPEGRGGDGASGPHREPIIASHRMDPHPTGVYPTLRLARAGDPEKYPMSKIF